ncbi:MAG: Hsp70 family protein [Desulfamplus sp.]|nr:Hsp70 family protein [Desulfamplus sp.]
MEPVIGIDLGTTNSEVAFIINGKPQIIKENDNGIVPSCVSLDASNNIIVGTTAKNQAVLYPQKTILSVKRLMGKNEQIALNGQFYTPQEISAFILRELKERAQRVTGQKISKAIITTPAYFTDAQRQATREAGEIAGLNVVRILNEPTAAALVYETGETKESQRIMVYDLGGGTFDVSIVRIEEGVVEVLASTGDNHLGGDDFDHEIEKILTEHLKNEFNVDITSQAAALARIKHAAEQSKIELSSAPFAMIQEDFIAKNSAGSDIHLSYELSRLEFESAIDGYMQKTMDSVNQALKDAAMLPSALDKIILVGGSTRIPKLSSMLEKKFNMIPEQGIDPDLCVAMGAAIQAGREMGIESSTLLLDITPYTFGTSALGQLDGFPSKNVFVPIIKRNSKLPAIKSEAFETVYENQRNVEILVYQGEKPNALDNVEIGKFMFRLTPNLPEHSIIILKYELDINGILKIKAVEKESGKEINGVIENAFSNIEEERLKISRTKIDAIWASSSGEYGDSNDDSDNYDDYEAGEYDADGHQLNDGETSGTNIHAMNRPKISAGFAGSGIPAELEIILRTARDSMDKASDEDKNEIINLIEDIQDALKSGDESKAREIGNELEDILFYIE